MTGRMQTISIPCRGGLNLSSNRHELLSRPGEAISLVNFECSKEGGYRRISGYQELAPGVPGVSYMKGVKNYKGVIAAKDDTVYHTLDNVNWVVINKDSTNIDETALGSATVLPRTDSVRYMFTEHQVNQKNYVFMVDGKNAPAVFSIINEDTTPLYRFKEITDDAGTALEGAKYCTMFKNQLILAGMTADPTSIYYSSVANSDLTSPEDDDKEIAQENFNGATSGSLSFGDVVTGIKLHRESLYVFCERSIYKVTGLDSGEVVSVPVTRDIGCIDGFTIQEIGGDLLFLGPDGLRTIAKTERLDDIELGIISRKISPIVDPRLKEPDRYFFISTVLREKNQYRLWFIDINNPVEAQRGIIAAFTYIDDKEGFQWAFSETLGLGVTCVDNGYYGKRERIIHGNQSTGTVYEQEQGHTFDGTRMVHQYQSPFTDFGDISLRKNIHKVLVNSNPEGAVEIGLDVRYDYFDSDTFQPDIYPLDPLSLPAIFGGSLSLFGSPVVLFGATVAADTNVYTEGSGFTISFRIKSLDTIDDFPFDIQSLQIEMTPGGKI